MRIHNLYADENGESHFRDMEIDWERQTESSKISKVYPAKGLVFLESSPSYQMDPHTAPRRQYVFPLNPGAEIVASDGEVRVLGPGDVLLVEDTTGKGHIARSIGTELRNAIWVLAD